MDNFKTIQKMVNEELRKREDKLIDSYLTEQVLEDFECPDCRERLSEENSKVYCVELPDYPRSLKSTQYPEE